jgi:hypothetical protein
MSVSWSDDLPKTTISRIARATIAELEKRLHGRSEAVAGAIANRSNELGLDADGRVALYDICQEELARAAPDASDRSGPSDYIPTGGAGNGA